MLPPRVVNVPAVASWLPDCRLEKVFLDMHWISQGHNTGAFFKIHTRVQLNGTTSTRRDGSTSIFIFIPPERIRQLFIDPQLA